jgi:hypothetical protein
MRSAILAKELVHLPKILELLIFRFECGSKFGCLCLMLLLKLANFSLKQQI